MYSLDIWISNIKGIEYMHSLDIWISNIKGIYRVYVFFGYMDIKY